jgi:hypothetical protein
MDAMRRLVTKRRKRPVFFFFGIIGGATLADPVPVGGIGEAGLGATVVFSASGAGGSLGIVVGRDDPSGFLSAKVLYVLY